MHDEIDRESEEKPSGRKKHRGRKGSHDVGRV
jgi:hypothetical protein